MRICEVSHFIYFLSAVHPLQLFDPVGTSLLLTKFPVWDLEVQSGTTWGDVWSYGLKGVMCDFSR